VYQGNQTGLGSVGHRGRTVAEVYLQLASLQVFAALKRNLLPIVRLDGVSPSRVFGGCVGFAQITRWAGLNWTGLGNSVAWRLVYCFSPVVMKTIWVLSGDQHGFSRLPFPPKKWATVRGAPPEVGMSLRDTR